MSSISISDIRRNTNDFSFVDTLGSFINNYEFKQSYDQLKLSNDNKSSYIWNVISAIGGEYADTIYENVLNYIDNVANVDLCKVKCLQSMIKVLGIDYDVVNDISKMPVEIVNLIDILSVNKRYLLDNKTFAKSFRDIIKKYDFGKCIAVAPANEMSSELSNAVRINDKTDYLMQGDDELSVSMSDYFVQPGYIDNAQYKLMLVDMFRQLIESNIYMQYADAQNQLSSQHTYIYQYISDKLLAKDTITVETADSYDDEIKSLKIKYRLQGFKQDEVLDAIEAGNDYFDKYNQYQQAVLSAEQKRRNATYPYAKTYTQSEDSSEGYSLTRYSWYREQKVMEYFKFVEDTYSNLINAKSNDIESVLKGTSNTQVNVYDKDENYFVIDQTTKSSLLYYDRNDDTPSYKIRSTYISVVAELLAQQVLDLADIREQIKIQLRKSYMKGTFLLLSYVINEYLKYDISKNYGNVVYTQDENIPLSSFIDDCIKNNGVEIVEYKDPTEYFNQRASNDLCVQSQLGLSILNLEKANDKFYDNEESKLGKTTHDIPLEEIDAFYRKQLNLQSKNVQTSSDLVNFLSLIYDYGANESFLADRSDDISSKFRLSGEFYCKVWNDTLSTQQWQGDIDTAYALYAAQLSIANEYKEHLQNWKAEHFEEEAAVVSTQLTRLSNFISAWWHDKISADNASFRKQVEQQQKDDLYEVNQTSADMMNISADFQSLYNDSRYETYFKDQPARFNYDEHITADSISDILNQFYKKCIDTDVGKTLFVNVDLTLSINILQGDYSNLNGQLQKLISGYVKEDDYWPYYYTNTENEITSQTQSLLTYLQNQLAQIESQQKQHFQNHLDALISYKNEILGYIATCNNTYELFNAMYSTADNDMYALIGKHLTDALNFSYTYWGRAVIHGDETYAYETHKYNGESKPISRSPILDAIDELKKRCSLSYTLNNSKSQRYRYYTEDGKDKRYLDTCYDSGTNNVFEYLYNDQLATQINESLYTMMSTFRQVCSRVDAELSCLNVSGWTFSYSSITPDNVGSLLSELLAKLLDIIKQLDTDYIKVDKIIATDKFVSTKSSKVDRINQIVNDDANRNLGDSKYWNIKAITNEFNRIKEAYDAAKDKHRNYLSEFADSGIGKLSDQFNTLLRWCTSHDETCQAEVLAKLSGIIADYVELDSTFKKFVQQLSYEHVSTIDSNQQYVISSKFYKQDYSKFESDLLDTLIKNVVNWLNNVLERFDESADNAISKAIPKVDDFIEEMKILAQLDQLLKENGLHDIDDQTLTDVLEKLAKALQGKMDFVESQREHYDIQKEIFLKYNGTKVGYDPFYNFKNLTHSSYQIHPYLYNFVEVNNLVYPLANTFFTAFNEDYEKQLVKTGVDNIIGKFGNIINLGKHGMFDWTGYQSQYERDFSGESDINVQQLPEQFAYAGAFYPPALDDFLADSQTFIQKVQDNDPDSYYYKLNLSQEELNKIAEQLRIYEKPIREIVRCPRDARQRDNTLSAEYDIYKYTQDIYGNSLILFKSYKHLYRENANNKQYQPSYNEKKNAPGELWMRIKNHPIAFPAFDLRPEFYNLTQYYNTDIVSDQHKMNGYIKIANDYFSNPVNFSGSVGGVTLADVTKDAIQLCYANANQHMRCFFDMELTPDKRSLLLVVPMQTGTAAKRGKQDWSTFTYGNTNVIVGQLWQDYDYVKDMNMYAFQTANIKENVENVTNNVDNIRPSKDLLTTNDVPSSGLTREVCEFIGFAKHSNYIIALYAYKFWYSQKKMLKSFVSPNRKNARPVLQLECWCYNGTRKRSVVATQELKYDILYKEGTDYKYANTIAVTSNDDTITVCYISDEFQKAYSPKAWSKAKKYTDDTTIVNFVEYTNVVDKSSLTAFGENVKYPSDTAVLQTTDAQHINIYNSFDSFTSYIVNADFKFVGSRIVAKQLRHYNLNTDCGYYPLFADKHGKSRLYANSALSSKSEYSFQLLGPENSDIDYTPVILDTNVQEQNGRVTEDYRDYSKQVVFNDEIDVSPRAASATVTFQLRDVFVDDNGHSTYDDLAETGTLTKYKWNIANTSYTATPVARGTLAQADPTDYYYVSSSMYDTLSGQEMFGPNGLTFQGTTSNNHIDGISAIDTQVLFNDDNLPFAIQMTIMFDERYDMQYGAIIPESQFQLLLYAKNSNITYDYYRIIENAYTDAPGIAQMMRTDADEISFKDAGILSDFQIDGKYPFRNISSDTKYKEMIAPYMFKYSEEDPIDREFPLLAASDVNDEVVYLANEDQYIYFFAVDGYDTIEKDIFYMDKYDTSMSAYTKVKVNTISKKYQEFYDKALTIETTYNVEDVDDGYGIVLYFNYKNYTSPSYVNFKKRYAVDGTPEPPEWSVCTSTSKGIEHTYLRLAPGKSGRLDIRVDYVEYAKVNKMDLGQSVVGKESRTLRTYYIMNVSDDKPKFVISRQPFR